MSGWAWVTVVILAALTGTLVAFLTDAARSEMRRYDEGLDRIDAQIDAERDAL